MRTRLKSLVCCISILLVLFVCALFVAFWLALKPSSFAGKIEVDIYKGASAKEVARILKESGAIRSKLAFEAYARLTKKDKAIKAGLYEFSLPAHASEILKKLVLGEVKLVKLTIPEGLTIKEIDALLAGHRIFEAGEFERAANSSELIKELGTESLEGFLFPDTYFVRRDISASELVALMTKRFFEVFDKELQVQAERKGMSVLDVVKLASLIEKETSVDEERPLVSAVFHNRLKKGMLLQSDPSVIYGLENFDGNLTREHLKNPHPYNTYVHLGLPKGPICNPSKSSLVAALNPADVDYLYFVSKGDGTHIFSSNYSEHSKAVWEYQIKGKR